MVRARLAFLMLASSLSFVGGCASWHESECSNGGWFSRFRLASRTTAPCDCDGSAPAGDGSVVMPPNVGVPPGTMVTPGAYAPPPPTIMTNPPGASQPPRIVPVPQQAYPMPYTPPQ